MKPQLTLVRGLPGSGKSTFAKTIKNAIHLEADMWFMIDGEYEFNPSQLGYAHSWCKESTHVFLNNGYDVVVSNTFSTEREISEYREMAIAHKAPFVIYTMMTQFDSVHNVPEATIKRMKDRWQNIEGEILIHDDSAVHFHI